MLISSWRGAWQGRRAGTTNRTIRDTAQTPLLFDPSQSARKRCFDINVIDSVTRRMGGGSVPCFWRPWAEPRRRIWSLYVISETCNHAGPAGRCTRRVGRCPCGGEIYAHRPEAQLRRQRGPHRHEQQGPGDCVRLSHRFTQNLPPSDVECWRATRPQHR
jgi:hypothetical protein